MNDNVAAVVWRFHEAPEKYQALSCNGGDEDWLAFVPLYPFDGDDAPVGTRLRDGDDFHSPYLSWASAGTPFGVCCVDTFRVEGGWVLIGSHA